MQTQDHRHVDSTRMSIAIDMPTFSLHVCFHHGDMHRDPPNTNACVCELHTPKCSMEIDSQPDEQQSIAPPGKLQWVVTSLVILVTVLWVIAALITQSYFLLSSIPVMTEVVVYALRKAIDAVFSLRDAQVIASSPAPIVQKQ